MTNQDMTIMNDENEIESTENVDDMEDNDEVDVIEKEEEEGINMEDDGSFTEKNDVSSEGEVGDDDAEKSQYSPRIFKFSAYGKYSDLDKDMEAKVASDEFLDDLSVQIHDWKNITVGTRLARIIYDKEYFCVYAEKCEFCGFFLESMENLSEENFKLQFRSLDSKSVINIPMSEARYQLFGSDQDEEIQSAIKKYFVSFVKSKTFVFNKIEAMKAVIFAIQKARRMDESDDNILDYQKISDLPITKEISDSLLPFSSKNDIPSIIGGESSGEDGEGKGENEPNCFDLLSDLFTKMLNDFYFDNKVFKLDGKHNGSKFSKTLETFVEGCRTGNIDANGQPYSASSDGGEDGDGEEGRSISKRKRKSKDKLQDYEG